jgi:hypothetical protein
MFGHRYQSGIGEDVKDSSPCNESWGLLGACFQRETLEVDSALPSHSTLLKWVTLLIAVD